MSRYARATVYDKNTGKYIGKGGAEDARIERFRREGHIIVDGSQDKMTKWDFQSGGVVVDLDKQQEQQQKEQNEKQAKQDRREARQWLRDNTITANNQLTALQHMQTLLK